MRNFWILVLALLLLMSSLVSCGNVAEDDKNITIVTTIFPEYDWVRQILGDYSDNINLVLLVQNGTDLHSYQPTVADIATISDCDILVRTGGMSDSWIDDVLAASPDKERIVVELMDLLSDEEKLGEQSHHHNAGHEHGGEHDEHVWLSLRLAARFCLEICDAICRKCPEYAEAYSTNCSEYTERLRALDEMYMQSIGSERDRFLLFADRFPFSYLMHDYGVTCFAAFPGCSAESEASFETIAYLADQVDAHSLPAVIILENSDSKIADTVIAATKDKKADIVILNSLQSVTSSSTSMSTGKFESSL